MDPHRHIMALDALERHDPQILYSDSDTLLMRAAGAYTLLCPDPAKLPALAARLTPDAMLHVYNRENLDYLMTHTPFVHLHRYLNVVLDPDTPLDCPEIPGVAIRPLTSAHHAFVRTHYTLVRDDDYIAERIAAGMLGAWLNHELVGFIGEHEGGAMGLLQVLPHARRRGIARALECALVQRLRAQGRRVYGNIDPANTASLALHRASGYYICKEPVYWLFPEE